MTGSLSGLKQVVLGKKNLLLSLKAEKDISTSENNFAKTNAINHKISSLSSLIRFYEQTIDNQESTHVGTNIEDIFELENKASGGDTAAIEKLVDLSKMSSECGEMAKGILAKLAKKGDETVAKILIDNNYQDPVLVLAVLKSGSSYTQTAAERLADKDATGKTNVVESYPEIKKLVVRNLGKDPERNVSRLAKFADSYEGISALSDIAETKSTSFAGRVAARALASSFAKSNNRKSDFALDALKKAGCAGNPEASKALGSLVRSNILSSNRAMKAIDVLTDIARSSSQNGSEGALGEMVGIAKDKRVSSGLRNYAIKNLGKLIEEGHDNNFTATDSLMDIARSKSGARVTDKAVKTLFKVCDKKPEVLDRAVPLIYDVAKGSVPADKKAKLFAVYLLEKASGQNGGNSTLAKQSLVNLTKNHNQSVAMRAGSALERNAINPQEYNTDSQKPNLPMMRKDAKQLKPTFTMVS